MAVTDYNTSADANTFISGLNIAEGFPSPNMNNAIRQAMADVKSGYNSLWIRQANNLSDVASAATARTNLGITTHGDATYTVSSSAPSGGANGDIWYRITAVPNTVFSPNLYVKSGGTWYTVAQLYKKISGTWTAISKFYVNRSGTWTQVYDRFPIIYVDTTSATLTCNGTAQAVANPSQTNGDIMIAMAKANGYSASAPAGWTSLATGIWYRIASSEPASYNWPTTSDTSSTHGVIIAAFRGGGTPTAGSVTTDTSSTITGAAVTATGNEMLLMASWQWAADPGFFGTFSLGSSSFSNNESAHIKNSANGSRTQDVEMWLAFSYGQITAEGSTGAKTYSVDRDDVPWNAANGGALILIPHA